MLPAAFADGLEYLRMAQHQTAAMPFRARVLTPWLVSLWPGDPRVGFFVVTLGSLLALCVLYARSQSWTHLPLLVTIYYPVGYSLRNPYLVDPLLFVILYALVGALRDGRGALAAGCFVLGAFDKEVILIALPLLLWYRPKGAVVGALLACAISLWLRWPLGSGISANATPGLRGVASGLWYAGALFYPLVALGYGRASDQRILLGLLPGVVILTLTATDTGRMLGLLVPFWIPLAVAAIGHSASVHRGRESPGYEPRQLPKGNS
jgi:hypothetical protein